MRHAGRGFNNGGPSQRSHKEEKPGGHQEYRPRSPPDLTASPFAPHSKKAATRVTLASRQRLKGKHLRGDYISAGLDDGLF
jgi:hypothetical protein